MAYRRLSAFIGGPRSFSPFLLWQKAATINPARRQKRSEAGGDRIKLDVCARLMASDVGGGEPVRAGTACAVRRSRRIAVRDGSQAGGGRHRSDRGTSRRQSRIRRASELSNRRRVGGR